MNASEITSWFATQGYDIGQWESQGQGNMALHLESMMAGGWSEQDALAHVQERWDEVAGDRERVPENSYGPIRTPELADPTLGLGGGTATPAASTSGTMALAQEAYTLLHTFLTSAGLGHLFTWDAATNTPGGFIWDEIIKKGMTTQAEIQIILESNGDFQKRFKSIFDLRAQAAQGAAIDTSMLTPANILEYENTAASLMEFYGMPRAFYDSYEDFQNMITQGIRLPDLTKAVSESWNRVANTDPAIRAQYQEWYGAFGDTALAASFLDPEKMNVNMDVFSRAAAIGGTGRLAGIGVDRGRAERLARFGFDERSVQQGFSLVKDMELDNMLDELYGERDLTQMDALDAAFELDQGEARRRFDQRQRQRRSAFEGAGTGGALLTSQGAVGLGRYRSGG